MQLPKIALRRDNTAWLPRLYLNLKWQKKMKLKCAIYNLYLITKTILQDLQKLNKGAYNMIKCKINFCCCQINQETQTELALEKGRKLGFGLKVQNVRRVNI